MDFNVTASKKNKHAYTTPGSSGREGSAGAPYGSSAQLIMYEAPPVDEVALEEFEQFALDRLRVLKAIDEAKARGKKHEEMDVLVNELWRKHMRTTASIDTARKDTISHFVLRLAYCQTEELRRWLLTQETALFRHRFRSETPENQRRFLEACKLPYKAIGSAEFEAVKEKLGQVARSINQPLPTGDSIYYKVPFEEVPELVAGRRVYLHRGSAYVPRDQLASIVVGQFRAKLSKALVLTNRHWTATVADEERDRLTPLVEVLSTRYLGADYSQPIAKGHVSLSNLDALAHKSFPLCMRHLYFKLREDHHLRHGGRLQFGLFLKGIGLTLEDALTFWRSEFSQKMGVDKFEKEYAYGVRYNYGKEGKRTDYTPYSCMKIIMGTPGVGDHHGCPFRHFSEENLRAALGGMRLAPKVVNEAVDKVKNHHYQLACATTFEGSHGCACDVGINHPNQYFEQSQKVLQPAGDDSQGSPSTPHNTERPSITGGVSPMVV